MDNINDLLSSLTAEDMERLQSMANDLFGGSPPAAPSQPSGSPELPFSPELLQKLSSVMQRMNGAGDARVRLIEALKPNLSSRRQKKAEDAMQILRMLELLPLLTAIQPNERDDKHGS